MHARNYELTKFCRQLSHETIKKAISAFMYV